MNRQTHMIMRQIELLSYAVGNSIDKNPNTSHITMAEIHEWLDDILAMTDR